MFGIIPSRKENLSGTLTPYTVDPFGLMRREFDTLFDRFFGTLPASTFAEWEKPAWGLEAFEDEKEFIVRAEAPGFEAGDFDVRVNGEVLTIVAEHKEEKKEKDKGGNGAKKSNRSYARLERLVTLPTDADSEKVAASYRNGVLELHFSRKPEAEGKRIEVKA